METCYNVRLTSDDILTLRLTRDRLQGDLFDLRECYARYEPVADRVRILETLNSILDQCTTPAAAISTATNCDS